VNSSRTLELVRRAEAFGDRVAIVDAEGTWTYADLLERSADVASVLLDGRSDLDGARVGLLVPSGFDHVAAQWAAWRAGAILVPMSPAQTAAEWADTCDDAGPGTVIVEPSLAGRFAPVAEGRAIRVVSPATGATLRANLPSIEGSRPGLMLYTSGTTSKPKGVVLTHANIQAQVECLVQAWGWRDDDRIPLVLPLNHVHGLINILTSALWSGAVCEIPRAFDAVDVWARIASGELTVLMAVPTSYRRLIAAWEAAPADVQQSWSAAARCLRVMVSGSAALPVSVLGAWRDITGHTLLERYGMTEIGMALSNPLAGERRVGFVGRPLPGVDVRLLDERGADVAEGTPGEIHVRGAGVFRRYWNREAATADAFRDGGWFRTGDVAVVQDGMYRILGRLSVDIIKTGGEKVSALEIEDALREHPSIADCAVVGMPDADWGECVSVAVVPSNEGTPLDLDRLRAWARATLSGPKLPRRLLLVEELPRNAMGKVSKPRVIQLFEHD
jgi:malonyl-CoA/methylmalonyl-CoA synthetase